MAGLLYLMEMTRSLKPSPNEIRSPSAPRSFAPWSREERQLRFILSEDRSLENGLSRWEVASMLERTEHALKWEEGKGRRPGLDGLPQSRLPISQSDIEILRTWNVAPLRDPLGWQFGKPAGLPLSDAGPTLLVVTVRPDPQVVLPDSDLGAGSPWPVRLQELDNLARSAWVDIAAQVVASGGLVLHAPTEDTTALRTTLKRTLGESAPRLSVRAMNAETAFDASLVLLSNSALAEDCLPALRQVHTLVVVRPQPLSTGAAVPRARFKMQLPYALQVPPGSEEHWPEQVAFLNRWRDQQVQTLSHGRSLQEHTLVGVPNSHHRLARLNWTSLRHMPDSGTVHAATDDLLIRAASWFTLSTGRRARLPEGLEPELPFGPDTVPLEDAQAELCRWCSETGKTTGERALLRCWLDVRYMEQEPEDSDLTFRTDPEMLLTYIGH